MKRLGKEALSEIGEYSNERGWLGCFTTTVGDGYHDLKELINVVKQIADQYT